MRPTLFAFATLSLCAQDERTFVESLARLERQDPAGAKDLAAGSPVRTAAMALEPARATERVRFAAASWLWAANLIQGFSHGKEQTYLQAARGQADLLKAWSLLETVDGDLARARDGLRLELAWRLLDLHRLRAAYGSLSARPALSVRELAHCFFASAHLGDWPGLKAHARALQAQGGRLEGLHAAAEGTLTMFDYASLLKAVDMGDPAPAPAPLSVRSHRISKWRVRVGAVSGNDEALLKASRDWPKGWVDRPEATTQLLQVGAAAHWVEGSGQPPVSGFLEAARLYLVGYRDSSGAKGEAGRQEQVWDLRPDPQQPGRWRGTHTVTARVAGADPAKGPALQATFEVEWDMRTVEDYPEARTAAPSPKPAP